MLFRSPDGTVLQAGQTAAPTPVAPTPAPAPVAVTPSAPPPSTGPTVPTGQTIVAGTEIGHQVPGAYTVDNAGTYYDVNGRVVATTQANGGVVGSNGVQLIEPTTPAPVAPTPAPGPMQAGPGPIQGGPQLVGGPVAPTGPMPNLPANVDQAIVQNFLNQGYTQQQIQAAVDANPNGGWGRSLMWGEQGAPGATPPSLIADRKSTRLNSSHSQQSRMPSSA